MLWLHLLVPNAQRRPFHQLVWPLRMPGMMHLEAIGGWTHPSPVSLRAFADFAKAIASDWPDQVAVHNLNFLNYDEFIDEKNLDDPLSATLQLACHSAPNHSLFYSRLGVFPNQSMAQVSTPLVELIDKVEAQEAFAKLCLVITRVFQVDWIVFLGEITIGERTDVLRVMDLYPELISRREEPGGLTQVDFIKKISVAVPIFAPLID